MNIKKALVVDDSKVAHLTLRKLLLERGVEVDWVGSGEDCIKYLETKKPSIIFMDVMMPGMDGPQALEQLVNLVDINVVPVAFMTAKVQPAEVEHYLSLGARDVIIKPFDPMQLASQIRAIWSRSNG